MTDRNTIILQGFSMALQCEAEAHEDLYPGMLLQERSDGKLQKHGDEGGIAERLIAYEDELQGKTMEEKYDSGERVLAARLVPGSKAQLMIKADEEIAIGDELISAGDGTFIEDTSAGTGVTVDQVVAIAVEACDLTATSASNTLCAARIL